MSGLVMGLVWELPLNGEFGRAEKYILLAYADHSDQNGGNIFPSVDLVSEKTGYAERAVQMSTRTLEKLGFLVSCGFGPNGTNRWRIPVVRADGGAKIAPLPMSVNAPEEIAPPPMLENAPEGNAPEGNAPETIVVVKDSEREGSALERTDFIGMPQRDAASILELQTFQQATGKFPGQGQWWMIYSIIRAQGLTVKEIREIYEKWCIRGYNPANIDYLLYARAGDIPSKTQPTKGKWAKHENNKSDKPTPPATATPEDRAAAARVLARKQAANVPV